MPHPQRASTRVLKKGDGSATTITGSSACKRMLGRIKDAYAGSGGCGSVDCNKLENGKKDAEECALDLGVALQDAGVPDSAATKTWQSVATITTN